MFYVWLSLKIISTFYTIFWDFKMDFGFFAASNGASRKNGCVLAKMFIMLLLALLGKPSLKKTISLLTFVNKDFTPPNY